MKHGHGQTIVDQYIEIKQRHVVCNGCQSTYTGPKEELKCMGCGKKLKTIEVACVKKVPVGTWVLTTMKRTRKPSGPSTAT